MAEDTSYEGKIGQTIESWNEDFASFGERCGANETRNCMKKKTPETKKTTKKASGKIQHSQYNPKLEMHPFELWNENIISRENFCLN